MSNNRRIEKVASLLRKEISLILMHELENDLIIENFLSVTKIELSADLQYCKVFINSSVEEKIKMEIIEILNSSKNLIRYKLSQRIVMRRIPDICFKQDALYDKGISVLKVLDDIREKKKDLPDNS